jgi:hypothetical protein
MKELIHYLTHVFDIWSSILGELAEPSLLDSTTVYTLQLMVPEVSTVDKSRIKAAMESKSIFLNVKHLGSRAGLLDNITRVPGRIPSLFTFFEDTKYLEPCSAILRTLLPDKANRSLTTEFHGRYIISRENQGSTEIETSDSSWTKKSVEPELSWYFSYLQLWLFAMRHFPFMHNLNPRKDPGQPKPQYKIREDFLATFSQLAFRLGFRSPEISKLKGDPTERLVRDFFEAVRPRDEYQHDTRILEDEIARVTSFLNLTRRSDGEVIQPRLVSDTDLPLLQRCGRPYNRAYLENRQFLYLPNFSPASQSPPCGSSLSSFGVQYDLFRAFFSIPSEGSVITPVPDPVTDGLIHDRTGERNYRVISPTAVSSSSRYTTNIIDDELNHSLLSRRSYSPASFSGILRLSPPLPIEDRSLSQRMQVTTTESYVVYLNLLNGQVKAFTRQQANTENLTLVYTEIQRSFPNGMFISGINESGSCIGLPKDLINSAFRLCLFGEKGKAVRNMDIRQQAIDLAESFFPSINAKYEIERAIGYI